MTYRNTKQSSTGVSHAVLMFGRRLSTIWDRLRPNIQTTVQSRREEQKMQHDIRAQPRSFLVSQSVWLRDTQRKRWELGYIMSKNGSESYTVDIPAGPRRRHANDIRNKKLRSTKSQNQTAIILNDIGNHQQCTKDALIINETMRLFNLNSTSIHETQGSKEIMKYTTISCGHEDVSNRRRLEQRWIYQIIGDMPFELNADHCYKWGCRTKSDIT
ncbi:hypothetical protein GJ496_000417 [Pomphorhynchus laevis]|nr:hypothetical protein GJ496_000417 [Pomphorhynchus laevis]